MKYFKIKEVADLLRVDRHTIYKNVKNGKIPAIRIGGQYRIPETFVNELAKLAKEAE